MKTTLSINNKNKHGRCCTSVRDGVTVEVRKQRLEGVSLTDDCLLLPLMELVAADSGDNNGGCDI